MTRFVVFVVVVACFAASVKSVDHRCQFTETKVENCTRPVIVPCSTETTTSSSSSASSSSEEGDDDSHSRKRRSVEDFVQNFLNRFFSDDDDGDDGRWCREEKTFQCIMYRCYIGCCPGWKWNATARTCSIPDDTKPGITCLNGGTPARGPEGWRCECPNMYTGAQCGEALCKLECMNNGMCDIHRGRPMCVCADNFNGSRCETPQCEGGCNGNGKCVVKDGRPMCRCRHEYSGRNCELMPAKPKKGQCPPITAYTLGTCQESCETDEGCPSNMKCCYNGCGHTCMQPANLVCQHEDHSYNLGEVFYPDECNVCTCLTPDKDKPFGGAQCRKPVCPDIGECASVREDPDSCCPYCADGEGPDLPDYEDPTFNNCPESIVTIDVHKDRNEASLPFTLVAIDFQNKKLEVKLTREKFQAGIGEQNFDTVIATSERDELGNYAYCEFHVRIRDIHAPTFSHCPPDVYLTKEGKAEWKEPKASDNVGLVRSKHPKYKSGDHFHKGEHPIVYTAEDYEGNMAKCSFFVKVGHYDEFHAFHDQDKHHGHRSAMYIGIGVAVFFFIVVLLLAGYLYRRCRRTRRDPPANPPAYDNNIYNIGATIPPPPYKEKPPMYISETEKIGKEKFEEAMAPPVYVPQGEEIPEKMDDVMEDKVPLDVDDVDVKVGVDNPAIRL